MERQLHIKAVLLYIAFIPAMDYIALATEAHFPLRFVAAIFWYFS
jgi:hypothetical protein